jgi:twinkle protein
MTNLRAIVENTGVGMLLISHLRVPQGKTKAHEEGGRVTLNQLRGSGSIKQLSDNIIAIERDQQAKEPNKSHIRLLKNRLFGMTGLADTAEYNIVTGRLLPVEDNSTSEFLQKETNYDNEEVEFNDDDF